MGERGVSSVCWDDELLCAHLCLLIGRCLASTVAMVCVRVSATLGTSPRTFHWLQPLANSDAPSNAPPPPLHVLAMSPLDHPSFIIFRHFQRAREKTSSPGRTVAFPAGTTEQSHVP